MKFSSIKNIFFTVCDFDKELLANTNRRLYLLILRLNYKGKKHDFAIPFRSNIPAHAHENLYFPLPPRPSTKAGHIHGLHFIKMFPIKKSFLEKFNIENDRYYNQILTIINTNRNLIIEQAQKYLTDYENNIRPSYCTSIDNILLALEEYELSTRIIALANKEVATSNQDEQIS